MEYNGEPGQPRIYFMVMALTTYLQHFKSGNKTTNNKHHSRSIRRDAESREGNWTFFLNGGFLLYVNWFLWRGRVFGKGCCGHFSLLLDVESHSMSQRRLASRESERKGREMEGKER